MNNDDPVFTSLKVWRGYTRIGYWKKVFASLKMNLLVISDRKNGPTRYRILVRLLKIKALKKTQFSITYGLKTLFFKAKNKTAQQKWVKLL